MTNQISQKQLSIIVGAGFTLTKIYVMPAFLSKIARESMWLCATLSLILDFFLLLIVIKTINNTNNVSIYDTGKERFSLPFNKGITFLYAIFFIV